MSKVWDNATLKKLKTLMGKGLSTAEIGKKIGMSKNAVVGKLNRLGWNSKAGGVDAKTEIKPVKTAKKPTAKVAEVKKTTVKTAKNPAATTKTSATVAKKAAPVKKEVEAPAKKAPVSLIVKKDKKSTKSLAAHQKIIEHPLGLANLKKDQCRWPIGDPDSEDFHFCGKKVFTGKPYCFEHCKQAYQ